jgi:hypothetical protein
MPYASRVPSGALLRLIHCRFAILVELQPVCHHRTLVFIINEHPSAWRLKTVNSLRFLRVLAGIPNAFMVGMATYIASYHVRVGSRLYVSYLRDECAPDTRYGATRFDSVEQAEEALDIVREDRRVRAVFVIPVED